MPVNYKTYNAYLDLYMSNPKANQILLKMVRAYTRAVRAKLSILFEEHSDFLTNAEESRLYDLADVVDNRLYEDSCDIQRYDDCWIHDIDTLYRRVKYTMKEYEAKYGSAEEVIGADTGPIYQVELRCPSNENGGGIVREVAIIINEIADEQIVVLR